MLPRRREYHWSVVGWHVDEEIPSSAPLSDNAALSIFAFTLGVAIGVAYHIVLMF